jgi:hypothetical protein
MFMSPLPLDIADLKLTVTTAIKAIDRNVLERVWDDVD